MAWETGDAARGSLSNFKSLITHHLFWFLLPPLGGGDPTFRAINLEKHTNDERDKSSLREVIHWVVTQEGRRSTTNRMAANNPSH